MYQSYECINIKDLVTFYMHFLIGILISKAKP